MFIFFKSSAIFFFGGGNTFNYSKFSMKLRIMQNQAEVAANI